MKKTLVKLLAIVFVLALVLSSAPLCFAASGSPYGIGSDPPAAYDPPALPDGYTKLTAWPDKATTGLQGYTKGTLPNQLYGLGRSDTVEYAYKPDWTNNDNGPDTKAPGPWTTTRLPYGQYVVSVDGTVIENAYIHGGLDINAKNVVVRNCYVEANDGTDAGQHVNGHGVINIQPGASASIINCEINGLSGVHAGIWHQGDSMVAAGNNIYNVNDGIFHWANNNEGQTDLWGNNFRIQDNWIHDLEHTTSNGHIDGWQTTGCMNGLVKNNYFDLGTESSGNFAMYAGDADGKYIMVEGNLFQGSGFTIYCYAQGTPGVCTNMWFINNAFSTKYSIICGAYGVWFTGGDPDDGWFNDPDTWKSFRLNNYFWDPNTNTKLGSADPQHQVIPDGAWACAGDGAFADGMHELGSNNTGLVATEFKLVPLMENADSGLGYVGSGMTASAWRTLGAIFKLNINGYFSLYKGPSGGYPLDSVPADTPDSELPQYVMRYKVGVTYQVRMVMDTATQTYSVWVTELDKDGNPVMAPFCVGENFGFRETAGAISDIGRIFTSPGTKDAYYVFDHKLTTSVLESTRAAASVEKLTGPMNKLTITVTETYRFNDGQCETKDFTEIYEIHNNAAGTYAVGGYNVYVNTKGNTQIRECYIID